MITELPPKEEWKNLNADQLFEIKILLETKYDALRRCGASYANEFLKFRDYVEQLIDINKDKV